MQHILVGYDGSETSGHALDQASLLAKTYACPLTVLTAADDHLVREDDHLTMAADENLARTIAEEGARRARVAGVNEVAAEISTETPLAALQHASQHGGYDLLVVGHRGAGGLRELFLGSTAKKLIERVGCSVLVVR